jgi:hypothetical protein
MTQMYAYMNKKEKVKSNNLEGFPHATRFKKGKHVQHPNTNQKL